MTTATIEHHTYETTETPMVNAEHYRIIGRLRFRCIVEDCDGVHHFWCSCAH